MEEKFVSNYDKVRENWRQIFLGMNQEDLIRRFGLKADQEALYLLYFHHEMRIDRKTGEITYTERPEKRPAFGTVLQIYNTFYYAVERPLASGKLVAFREVKRVYPFEQAYRRTILKKIEELFSGRTEALRKACEELGGVPMPQGDVGYRLSVYPGLSIAILFWDGDEEFPAKANILFDSRITDFMHEENVVGVASDMVYYLTEAAGLEGEEIYGA